MAAGQILVVDDDRAMVEVLSEGLTRRGFQVGAASEAGAALEQLRKQDFDVVLTDLRMPGLDGIELCQRFLELQPATPVLVMTAFGSMDTAVAAMRAGAYDFIPKPVDLEVVALAVDRALGYRRLRADVKSLKERLDETGRFTSLIGESEPMQRVRDLLTKVASSDVPVLLTGESGTGKEVAARALHQESRRAERSFVAINCAALPEALLESELFGHVRGAFTDAHKARTGLFQHAAGGTLLLDEIGEMPLSMQAKLLRVLQDRKIRPVGAESEIAVDVRVIAATNRELLQAVDEGRFRQDLYFRLNVIEVVLPPLRSRGRDVLLLAQRHLERVAAQASREVRGLSPEAAGKLLAYDWPGNVRELHNCIERAVTVTRYEEITVEDLPDRIREHRASQLVISASDPSELLTLEEVERRYIERVLNAVSGHRAEAARVLGIDRKTLYRKLERWRG
jgi:two-component system response regulator HydG